MTVIVADFETYYDADYSLSKLSTEEYLRSSKFETIGCSISIGGRPPRWYPQPAVHAALEAIDWSTSSLLAYNTIFDGSILSWHYGITPKFYLDAMGLARACGYAYYGAGLAKVASVMGLGVKGDAVTRASGKHYADFTPSELVAYGAYCNNDVELTTKIYRQLIPNFPHSELLLQDQILRLFIDPVLHFDKDKLQEHRDEVVTNKWNALASAADAIGLEWDGAQLRVDGQLLKTYNDLSNGGVLESMRAKLASNQQLAELLLTLGVDPPQKLSPATGLLTWAFSKSDPDFMALLEHEDQTVQSIVAARLGIKSTIEETRADRFIGVAKRGVWPVPLVYYPSHTGRLGGGDKVNPQNLRRGGKLRQAILPPPGHLLVTGDLSQIEARILNYIAGQTDVVETFRAYDAGEGPDVYCVFAGKVFNCVVTPEDKPKRTIGKVGELSLGFGAGKVSYKRMLFTQAKMHIVDADAQNVVDIYRTTHNNVKRLWDDGGMALESLLQKQPYTFGVNKLLSCTPDGIALPNGLFIKYPLLKKEMHRNGKVEYQYMHRSKFVKIYSSKVIENVVQALARIVMTDAWLRIAQRYRVVLSVHDELVCIAPIADAQECAAFMHEEMTRPVSWLPGLPIACTTGIGSNYGETK